MEIDYKFAIDNDLNTFEYNSLNTTFYQETLNQV